ncbi:MAG: efflux RND transporter permease subunit, partial [Firmicutes bacterium]|nr:efflux RND transporter permease subunit [Bacillota bacterium]
GSEGGSTETRITINRDAAMREGLTAAQIYQDVAARLAGKVESTTLHAAGGDEYPVIVIGAQQESLTRGELGELSLTVTDPEGEEKKVLLGDIAQISEAATPAAIARENQSRQVSVTASLDEGYNIGLVSRELEKKLADYTPPAGFTVEIAGENEMITSALNDIALMIILAVIFIYLIMVAQFQSLLSPFIILFTLPLAFTGGLLLLWVSGLALSVTAMLGFLVLAGIVVNNGIVYVDYVNQLRQGGMDKREALLEAGSVRLRPIVMTALTTILAMSTIALGMGSGAEMTQPMAVVAIGGLTYATLLTLLVVPLMYDFLHRRPLRKIEIEE